MVIYSDNSYMVVSWSTVNVVVFLHMAGFLVLNCKLHPLQVKSTCVIKVMGIPTSLPSLKLTAFAPENGPSTQKEAGSSPKHQFSGANYVSFRVSGRAILFQGRLVNSFIKVLQFTYRINHAPYNHYQSRLFSCFGVHLL